MARIKLKKVLVISLIFVMLFALTACDPTTFYFDYDELKETVVRVEYIYYDNPNAVILEEYFVEDHDKLLSFDFDKMEIRQVLSDEKLDDFLKELSELEFMMDWVHLDSPQGDSIRIVYDNGDFEILSCYGSKSFEMYSGSFYANGEVKRFIGSSITKDFLSKWFEL